MNDSGQWLLSLEDGRRREELGAGDLPVALGGGAQDGLRVSGLPTAALQLGRLEQRFFLLPGRHGGLRLNGEPFTDTRWLADGDTVDCGGRRLRFALDAEHRLRIEVSGAGSGGETLPPDMDALARAAGETPVDGPMLASVPAESIEAREYRARGRAVPRVHRRGLGPLALSAWAVSAVLAVLVWFAFTAKSVRVVVEPEPEALTLPGTLLKARIGDRWLLRSGTHRVRAELPGYHVLDETLEVGVAPDQQVRLRMQRLPGLVTLDVSPFTDGAEVFVDGERLGTLPFVDREVPHGEREFSVRAARFLTETFALEVVGGGERQRHAVELTPNWAPVNVASAPGGAELRVDGESVGTTPLTVELEAGTRQLELRLAGHNAWRETLRVRPGEELSVDAGRLQPADGRVTVASEPAGARVSVNGQYRGETPLTVTLPPGREHEVAIALGGYQTVRETLSVQADSGRRLEVDLAPVYGEVVVEVQPADAELVVNGRSLGQQRTLQLQAVPQTVVAQREGYASERQEVTPRPGFTQQLRFALLSEEEAREAAIPRTITTALDQSLLLFEGGRFVMGAPRGQQGRRSNEVQRRVELERRFYLGVHEVTNAQFRAFAEDHDSGRFSGNTLDGDGQPVVNVTWEQAARFMNWLSERDGLPPAYEERGGTLVLRDPVPTGYRLPTEAEWEFAARHAGRDAPVRFPWGDELPPPEQSGNFADVSAGRMLPVTLVTYNDGYPVSAPVGSFPANPAGLYDLGGNVAEWVNDFYEIPSPEQGEVLRDPLGPGDGRHRVVRGASWKHAGISELRLTFRDYSDRSREDVGFRIARYLE